MNTNETLSTTTYDATSHAAAPPTSTATTSPDSNMKEMYDSLSQQFTTLQLENEVYRKEIAKLRKENEQLREQQQFDRRRSNVFANETAPLFSQSIGALSAALDDANLLRQTAAAENTQFKNIVQRLEEENADLKEQVDKYEETVDMLQMSQNKQRMEYAQRVQELQSEIANIHNENSVILEEYEQRHAEYDVVKDSLENQLKTEMEAHQSPIPTLHDDATLKFHLKSVAAASNPVHGKMSNFKSNLELMDYDSAASPALVNYESLSDDLGLVHGDDILFVHKICELESECAIKSAVIIQLNQKITQLQEELRIKEHSSFCFSLFS